jgi:hypothetical protein
VSLALLVLSVCVLILALVLNVVLLVCFFRLRCLDWP